MCVFMYICLYVCMHTCTFTYACIYVRAFCLVGLAYSSMHEKFQGRKILLLSQIYDNCEVFTIKINVYRISHVSKEMP